MSELNLELVRRIYEVLDGDDVEALIELCAPDVEFVNPDDAIEPGTRRGHDGVRQYFATFYESFERWEARPLRTVAIGDRVVVEIAATMHGRGTGLSMDTGIGHIWTIRDGKIARWQWFREPEQAFRAAGLDPPSA